MLKNLQVLKYFEVKIKTYDQDGKAMKNLAQDDIQTLLNIERISIDLERKFFEIAKKGI